MSRISIIAIFSAVLGVIIGANMLQPAPEKIISPAPADNDNTLQELLKINHNLQTRLTAIETLQIEEQNLRKALSEALESLKQQINQKSNSVAVTPSSEPHLPMELTQSNVATNPVTEENDKTKQVLISLGLDETVTERIQQREEKEEMDRLYLRNTAIREGWFGTEKYFEKTREFNNTSNIYREELGDENYDYYLFNSGQNNRISVLSVISNSPAENAGIIKGDIISKYNHENIFSWSDLTRATTDGELGQQVSIIIERNSEQIELFVPRGPLGIRLKNIKVNPST